MSDIVVKPVLTPRQRLLGSRKFWVSFSSGITAVGAQVLPFLSLFLGWPPEKQAAFSGMCNAISIIVAGLGGVLVLMIGAEDSAEKVTLPPPSPNWPPVQGLPPRNP